jgi:hypothetical protein
MGLLSTTELTTKIKYNSKQVLSRLVHTLKSQVLILLEGQVHAFMCANYSGRLFPHPRSVDAG